MKRTALIWGIILCGAYVMLSLMVNAHLLRDWDHAITVAAQSASPHWLDLAASILSLVGSVEVTAVIFVALLILLARRFDRAGRSTDSTPSAIGDPRPHDGWLSKVAATLQTRPEVRLVLLFLLLGLLELQGKAMIDQPTPPLILLRYVFRSGTPTGDLRTANSFPSGHSARTTFLIGMALVLIASSQASGPVRKAAYAVLAIAWAVMLISRVYIGDHWTTDVIGGALLGSGLFLIAQVDWLHRQVGKPA